ncbi:MAG: hypothetical protein IT337_13730 [Thermomicrobiales bacterium]|nr:hypothetical protein [Thermomicrobiales bacterium]
MMDKNVISAKLGEPFPQQALKSRRAGGGKDLTYVEGHTVIHRLNDATGNTWNFSVDKIERTEIDPTNAVLMAYVTLEIPGLGKRSHIGVQSVNARGGEDLVKGCVTDALKKAATLFGVGLELYGPDYEAGELPEQPNLPPRTRTTTQNAIPAQRQDFAAPENRHPQQQAPQSGPQPATTRQLKFIQAIAREHGISDDELNAEVEHLYGRHLSELDRRDASAYIERLQSRRNVTELAS